MDTVSIMAAGGVPAQKPSEPVSGGVFREVMRRFPTGVTVVTTLVDGVPYGFTANAFASVSAEPPTILICVNREASAHPMISQASIFCVNILALEQVELARRFADKSTRSHRFDGIATHVESTGAPVLDGVLAFLDCRLTEEHTAGTHTVFLGEVIAGGTRPGKPLGYFDADYRDFGLDAD